MAERAEAKEKSAWEYVGVWVVLAVLTVTTWVLGSKVQLGSYSLPVSMLISVVKTLLVALFFMHLIEQKGARRVVFPVAVVFLMLLMGVTLIDAMTRVRMARPDVLDKELKPLRPASTRTAPPGSPVRWMGN